MDTDNIVIVCCLAYICWMPCIDSTMCRGCSFYGTFGLVNGVVKPYFYKSLVEIPDSVVPLSATWACANSICGPSSFCIYEQEHVFNCSCKSGFQVNSPSPAQFSCQDINECAESNDCHPHASCRNTVGSHDCQCNQGYSGNGTLCEDINECAESNDCHPHASCRNTVGSHDCQCNHGYSGNGRFCEDVNECAESNDCHPHASCRNTVGSHECQCNQGYSGNGTFCEDVDECSENTDSCHSSANCINTPGSYRCACNNFTTGNGMHCRDLLPWEGKQAHTTKTIASHHCRATNISIKWQRSNTASSRIYDLLVEDLSNNITKMTSVHILLKLSPVIQIRDLLQKSDVCVMMCELKVSSELVIFAHVTTGRTGGRSHLSAATKVEHRYLTRSINYLFIDTAGSGT